jgi:methylated-DNA-[protein]-cysteine S-methyltransferase
MKYFFPINGPAHCPVRGFILSADNSYLVGVDFVLSGNDPESDTVDEPTAVHLLAVEQIEAYFAGRLRQFDLPVRPEGTVFQQKVWAEIVSIPFGKIVTYGDVALQVGGCNMSRAVGQAANKNPIPLVIPCHRVVGRNGRMTGFAPGIASKSFLLAHERGGVLW